ncbi:MAG: NADH-quinone oxidoreductase subunit NuoH [Nitrospirota bacterium]|nr:NADH-quinone oxidoreductase subunit NuoH [Nitrospirota bacterium]
MPAGLLETLYTVIYTLAHIVAVLVFVLLNVAYLTLYERKVIAHMQVRVGPMRAGWHGILQPIADGIKLFLKEDIIPAKASKAVFILSPIICLVPALISFVVVPFGGKSEFLSNLLGREVNFYLADLNIGILYILAISSMGVYGIVMAGWASNSKYSLLGGLRSAAQMISYEIAMGLSIITVLMISQSLSLVDIINSQSKLWNVVFIPVGTIAFFIYFVAGVAETNRVPFDLPEAETELVAGFHTEYSGMKFAYFFLAEYANMLVVSAMAATLFFGGWSGPFLHPVIWFLIKVYAFIFIFLWLRATLPRYRYDQLMRLGWKFFLPLALVNVLATGLMLLWVK